MFKPTDTTIICAQKYFLAKYLHVQELFFQSEKLILIKLTCLIISAKPSKSNTQFRYLLIVQK